MSSYIKKNFSTILLFVLLALLLIPQTGTPIRVFVNRLVSFSPSVISKDKRSILRDYHWPLQTLEGKQSNFNRSQNRVILLNVWATWCPPCIAEMPSLQNLYNEFGEEVDFYFVSTEDPETVERFLRKKGYKLPVYSPLGRMPEVLETGSLPTTYLIAADGEIYIKKVGAADWDSEKVFEQLKSLLGQQIN